MSCWVIYEKWAFKVQCCDLVRGEIEQQWNIQLTCLRWARQRTRHLALSTSPASVTHRIQAKPQSSSPRGKICVADTMVRCPELATRPCKPTSSVVQPVSHFEVKLSAPNTSWLPVMLFLAHPLAHWAGEAVWPPGGGTMQIRQAGFLKT